MRTDMVRAYVESMLETMTGADKVKPDQDGDYPVRFREALYYVRLIGDTDPVVQVFATAVSDVPASPGLFEKLNEINGQIRFARIFWVHEQVLVESDLVGKAIDPEDFGSSCLAVATITDQVGPRLAKEFGGKTFFADQKTAEAATAPEQRETTGLYL